MCVNRGAGCLCIDRGGWFRVSFLCINTKLTVDAYHYWMLNLPSFETQSTKKFCINIFMDYIQYKIPQDAALHILIELIDRLLCVYSLYLNNYLRSHTYAQNFTRAQ